MWELTEDLSYIDFSLIDQIIFTIYARLSAMTIKCIVMIRQKNKPPSNTRCTNAAMKILGS